MCSIHTHQKRIVGYLKENIQINEREANIEANHILKFVLKKPISYLVTNQKTKIKKTEDEFISKILKKRSKKEPLAYILREWDFYGETFFLNKNSLIPRQDTELMIDLAINQFDKDSRLNILDLGTGSGVIGITLSKLFPNSKITVTDISSKALQVANKNIKQHKLKNIHSIESDWFNNIKKNEKFDLIMTNPPYVSKDDPHLINPELKFEPLNALVSADNGFSDIFKIIDESPKFLKVDGRLFIEHGYNQGVKVKKYLQKKSFLKLNNTKILTKKLE